ncbi:hypothetical protein BVRB_5g102120 [Beta vulgaris subsp. vulgaris]|nr:hypothetical protein BVRB_5g102120 [Beta vulgaris subsp. vulgaris]
MAVCSNTTTNIAALSCCRKSSLSFESEKPIICNFSVAASTTKKHHNLRLNNTKCTANNKPIIDTTLTRFQDPGYKSSDFAKKEVFKEMFYVDKLEETATKLDDCVKQLQARQQSYHSSLVEDVKKKHQSFITECIGKLQHSIMKVDSCIEELNDFAAKGKERRFVN